MAELRDYYSILQVNRRASQEDIERSYERLSRLYDPAQSKKRRAPERWAQIKEAYETLSDPAKRAEYDRSRNPRRLPGIGGEESAITRFLTSPYGLPSLAAFIGAIIIVAVLVAVFAGDDEGDAVTDITTPPPSVTASPAPTSVSTPPAVSGEEMTTESGLTIVTIAEGTGASPALGDQVVVHYTGWKEADGARFDTSEGGPPRTFTLGNVIEGWNEGLTHMKEGGTARLIIPGDLAYGEAGNPGAGIPADATLIFDIQLIDVIKTGETPAPLPSATPTPTPGPETATPTPEPAADPTATAEASP